MQYGILIILTILQFHDGKAISNKTLNHIHGTFGEHLKGDVEETMFWWTFCLATINTI